MTETGRRNDKLPQEMSEDHHRELEIGQILRQARAERGLSLEEVQEATRIRVRYLEALEKDNYEILPAAVYARGFLKTYADYLGLDGSELAEEVKKRQTPLLEDRRLYELPKEEEDFDDFDGSEPETLAPIGLGALGRFIPALTLAVVAVAILVGILYFIGRGSQASHNEAGDSPPPAKNADANAGSNSKPKPPEDEGNSSKQPPPDTSASGSTKSAKPSEKKKSEEPPAPDSLEVAISVTNGPSWLDIRADGEPVLAKVAYPGFSQTFQAKKELSIATGNAGAVEVEVNGQKVGTLGDSGEVLTRTFTLKSASDG